MNKNRPLSRREFNNTIDFKVNKINNQHRNNMSSFARRKNYNNNKLFRSISINSRNKFKEKPKLFSLLDINYKITNSRGTSFPEQYRRLTDDENKSLFGFSYKKNKNTYLNDVQQNLNNKSKENINLSENENNLENKKLAKCESDLGDMLKLKKNNLLRKKFKINGIDKVKNINKEINNNKIKDNEKEMVSSNNEYNDIYNIKRHPKNLTKILSLKSKGELRKLYDGNENEKNKENNRKDRWIPKGYDSYELLIKHPKLFTKKLKIEYSMKKTLSAKMIKDKAYKSDIFFFKPPSEKEVTSKYLNEYRDYQNSDIFNIKNDNQNLSKSGEKYLFKNIDRNKYNITRESNSQWKLANNNIPTLINSSSKDYNILSSNSKGISLSKEKIFIECENKKDKNSKMINNVNYMNPKYRQKGLTEFIDITRNGASNIDKDYINSYSNNPKCFFKNDEVCSSFYNIHFRYKDICKKPFVKNFFD